MSWISDFATFTVSALMSSPQIQSTERSMMKIVGTWLIAHGMTGDAANATTTALSTLVAGGIVLGLGMLSSARANSSGNVNVTPIAQSASQPA